MLGIKKDMYPDNESQQPVASKASLNPQNSPKVPKVDNVYVCLYI